MFFSLILGDIVEIGVLELLTKMEGCGLLVLVSLSSVVQLVSLLDTLEYRAL